MRWSTGRDNLADFPACPRAFGQFRRKPPGLGTTIYRKGSPEAQLREISRNSVTVSTDHRNLGRHHNLARSGRKQCSVGFQATHR